METTKNLETVGTRVAKTLKEVVNGREIFYQYETDDNNPKPLMVNFSTQGADGKNIGGSYTKGGGFNFNGNNITQREDLDIVNSILETILEIIK